ncbi:MAG: antitoxin VapB family protein [Thermoplasmata archaeon YP2-bin.285]|uniref:Antitoxin VapB family protein n=1 Tax=Candidatus Sysuiplasma superficiale TaxID=2823368 RepID=A0A8J7YLD5_9ARCH|nr:antitoxin VapB family protein [Candidatus Sysuiplasma superficiale]
MVKIISISDDTYQELTKRKAGRSFSETIRELLQKEEVKGDPKAVSRFWGTFRDLDAVSLKKEIGEGRTRSPSRSTRRL